MSAIEPAAFGSVLAPALTAGSADLRRGMVVASNEAALLEIGLGDEVTLDFGGTKVRQRVVGLYRATEVQPPIYVDVADVPGWFRDRATTVYATGADPAAVRAAPDAAFRDRPDVLVTDREGVIEAEMGEFVIAIFGVVNTLALSVLERGRELGVLRASRRLVRRAVRVESLVICGYGGLAGIAVGVLFGAVMQHMMLGRALFEFTVPYQQVGVALAAWWRSGCWPRCGRPAARHAPTS